MFPLKHLRRLNILRGHFRHQVKTITAGSGKDLYDYDLVVIGGGSGGLACAKEGAGFGKRVAVLDYVTPSTQGSVWGLGGTCVNVGCIPKKLMHQAALLGEALQDSRKYGWTFPEEVSHSWEVLVENVQNHIRSLNWGHRVQLYEKNVNYFNAKGSFIDNHTIKAVSKDGKEEIITTENVVIAVGGRPRFPVDIPGALQHGISSDDIFSLHKPPGKTLVIGASYVALECAGFLTGLGFETSVMVRSILLRGFDQQMANLVGENMKANGTNFIEHSVPTRVEKLENGSLCVRWQNVAGEEEHQDVFDTVMFAIGRDPATSCLHLDNVGVELEPKSNKIIVDRYEKTSVQNIYSIGDAIYNRPELTPVAIMAGKLLAKRLFSDSKQLMDYTKVPTAIFSPLEFGTVGLSEEDACKQFGEDNVEIYHAFYKPLEYTVTERGAEQCYVKVVCQGENSAIVGLHFLGPHAGEILQGFAAAMSVGLTYSQLSSTIAIHPTSAEEIVKIHITKRSGEDPQVTGC